MPWTSMLNHAQPCTIAHLCTAATVLGAAGAVAPYQLVPGLQRLVVGDAADVPVVLEVQASHHAQVVLLEAVAQVRLE